MNHRATIATVVNASFAYGKNPVLDTISFSMIEGEYVCLVGKNGSGKSTLLKILLGLITPQTGNIFLAGGLDAAAFLPQGKEGDNFPATVWEVVLSGCQRAGRFRPFYSNAEQAMARHCLELLGIADLAGRGIGTLSGGQRQRTFLARCLCRKPRLLLLDEPYNGLDRDVALSLSHTLTELQTTQNLSILMSSHDADMVASCASRVLVLDRKLVYDGSVAAWQDRYGSRMY